MAFNRKQCEICRKPFGGYVKPVNDHDHATGKYRGRICSGCNTRLGMFEDGRQVQWLIHGIEVLLVVAKEMREFIRYLKAKKGPYRALSRM